MKLTVATKDARDHIETWLTLWQGGTKITDREKTVLTEILLRRKELTGEGITEKFLAKLLFDADSRKVYCSALSISSYHLTNIIASLREKSILFEAEVGYELNPQMIPDTTLVINFITDDN